MKKHNPIDETTKSQTELETASLLAKRSFMADFSYYILCIFGAVFLGTKLFFLELPRFNGVWIFFFEHTAIFISSITFFITYFFISKHRQFTFGNYMCNEVTFMKNRWIILFSFFAAASNALGNLWVITSIKFADAAGSSPAAINSLLMLNVLTALLAGLIMFGERHSIIQYIGGIIIIGGILLITFERNINTNKVFTAKDEINHYTAILFTILACLLWSLVIIFAKCVSYYFNANIIEYSSLTMLFSGLMGLLTGIPLFYYKTPFQFDTKHHLTHMFFAFMAGIFTNMGQFSYFSSVSLGSVEVAQLFINMKPIVFLLEELIFLFNLPDLLAIFGVFIAIFGASLVVLGKPKDQKQEEQQQVIQRSDEA